ncbi:SLAM family member 8-like isoform X2 [Pseudorasbora parva]|uniref:SLAM family member 8-like isoform X2 n=1 Tax=Pseudorasbora parva TaxID=51549 RepID=UPI00351DCC10
MNVFQCQSLHLKSPQERVCSEILMPLSLRCLSLSPKRLEMNVFQESCCSILAVLLLFLLQGSRAYVPDVHVHKAVGDSLDLKADHPKEGLEVMWTYNGKELAEYNKGQIKRVDPRLFQGRLKMNKDNISITIEDLTLQDSGSFTIVTERKPDQLPTQTIVLHVHDLIRDVQIEYNHPDWILSKNVCMFHLRCQASGDPNLSYSWSGDSVTTGPNLSISVNLSDRATLTCTVNNTISTNHTVKTVECSGKPAETRLSQYLLIVIGASVVAVVIIGGSAAVCCWRRSRTGGESEDGITVYEDVNPDAVAKKRSESVANGMSIYETVDDMKVTKNLPQTLYDKINYQRHPAVSASTSSPYQEVL